VKDSSDGKLRGVEDPGGDAARGSADFGICPKDWLRLNAIFPRPVGAPSPHRRQAGQFIGRTVDEIDVMAGLPPVRRYRQ
jgi:hypothetical protein